MTARLRSCSTCGEPCFAKWCSTACFYADEPRSAEDDEAEDED